MLDGGIIPSDEIIDINEEFEPEVTDDTKH